jgi:hypothetical protein
VRGVIVDPKRWEQPKKQGKGHLSVFGIAAQRGAYFISAEIFVFECSD